MNSAKINPRIKEILLQLSNAKDYITLAEIARQLQVSTKTVRRDLPDVEKILHQYGLHLDTKTGVGIRLNAISSEKAKLAHQLNAQIAERIYTPAERLTAIIGQLLYQQEPIKLLNLTHQLKVAESTISNDLDKLEPWFAKHHLALIRKPGLGIYIQGTEQEIRKAIIHYIYENIDETDLLRILHDNFSNAKKNPSSIAIEASRQLLNLVEPTVIVKLSKILKQTEQIMERKLSDSAYIGLTVHLALAIKRLQTSDAIVMTKECLADLQAKPEYKIAEKFAEKINTTFHLHVPPNEIGYITMHLLGARNHYVENDKSTKMIDNFKLVKLATEIIKIAQQETKIALIKNEKLLIGLVNHLAPSIRRLQMNMEIRNPLLNDMKAHYPELIQISKKCAKVLEQNLNLVMPEAEIAYIAMHLGAAIESQHKLFKPIYKVVIACPTGMGTSRLLATQLEKEYDNLHIVDIISAIHLDEESLRKANIDFIIATVPIANCTIPVVVVNSLLLDIDKLTITNQMNLLNKTSQALPTTTAMQYSFAEKLAILTDYSQACLELLNNFFLTVDVDAHSIEQLIENICKFLKPDLPTRTALANAILTRESYGGTRIGNQQIVLLHCRSEIVTELYFGVIQIKNQITVPNTSDEPEIIKTAILMLAPQETNKNRLETISYLAKMLLERWGFVDLLHTGTHELVHLELSHMLEEFFREKNTALMEE